MASPRHEARRIRRTITAGIYVTNVRAMSIADRHLEWAGCFNVRDLGGLPTAAGGLTRRGAIVRSDSLGRLEPRGWEELEAYGIGTVVDLRNESELGDDAAPRPASLETVNIPLDVTEDRGFWDVW
jgi:protein-tyrosine phosphatase